MDETQKYLNSILTKRLGSVINNSAQSKNAHTVTRIPRQEEALESMPTVFRQKHQTVLMSQRQTSVESRPPIVIQNSKVMKEPVESVGNQRIQYMAISKRIQKKKEEEFISPTVDSTKYKKNQNQLERAKSETHIIYGQPEEQRLSQKQPVSTANIQEKRAKRRKIFT